MRKINDMLRNERGNALFLILIAVALFAALSYAVTRSGRGGGTIDKEQALISASQLTQFPASMRTATTRMVITGTGVEELDFTNPGTGQAYEVFDSSGGGALYQDPPANIGGATAWAFLDYQHATNGFYVSAVGTDADDTGREVIAYIEPLSDTICAQILKGLGLSTTIIAADTIDYAAASATYAEGTNVFGYAASLDGEPFACEENQDDNENVYYHALVEQ